MRHPLVNPRNNPKPLPFSDDYAKGRFSPEITCNAVILPLPFLYTTKIVSLYRTSDLSKSTRSQTNACRDGDLNALTIPKRKVRM
ncbi:MAG: hypothetical protein GX639_04975 [Fibrobacter sp.]|nr:hypothetical protein [Fibrobacter sp.]